MDEREEFRDELAVLRAAIDQAIALAPELARSAHAVYTAMVGQGFAEKQALYLTAAHMLQNPGVAP